MDIIPHNLGTAEKTMRIATGHSKFVYENSTQFGIALKDFATWCIDKNVAPFCAVLAYYLNTAKETLIKYTKYRTEYTCYNLISNDTNEYIYSTNDNSKLDKYINSVMRN